MQVMRLWMLKPSEAPEGHSLMASTSTPGDGAAISDVEASGSDLYFMSRLVKKLMSSMKEIKREEDLDAGDAVVDVEAE